MRRQGFDRTKFQSRQIFFATAGVQKTDCFAIETTSNRLDFSRSYSNFSSRTTYPKFSQFRQGSRKLRLFCDRAVIEPQDHLVYDPSLEENMWVGTIDQGRRRSKTSFSIYLSISIFLSSPYRLPLFFFLLLGF